MKLDSKINGGSSVVAPMGCTYCATTCKGAAWGW